MRLAHGVALILPALFLLVPVPAHPWGAEGHRIAATITAARLCPAAESEVERLLDGMSLAEAAVWPDRIRREAHWEHTREWHYVNIDDDAAFSELAEGEPGVGRLLSAIRQNLELLADAHASDVHRREALAFVVHLVGDLHQPLHVGRHEDRGGTRMTVRFDGQEMNLHQLWDIGLQRSAALRPEDYRRSLEALIELGATAWESGSPQQWAEESRRLRPWVYDFDARRRVPQISRRYAETGRQLSALRLAQAGVRTAWLMNQMWCAD